MPTRTQSPAGAPCWADLWTSDVAASRRFYGEVFGWKAEEPDPTHGGYFMFTLDGIPVAGAMGPMPGMTPTDRWRTYLASQDAGSTLAAAAALGAEVLAPPMAVDDVGVQAALTDPTGADVGIWQAGTFPGFTVIGEPGAPGWFELQTRDHTAAVAFYREVFGWRTEVMSDDDAFRYTVMVDPDAGQLAGIMDAGAFLPEAEPSAWSVYWVVDDTDDAVGRVTAAGGSVVDAARDTPFGRLATVTDPNGGRFKLHAPTAGGPV